MAAAGDIGTKEYCYDLLHLLHRRGPNVDPWLGHQEPILERHGKVLLFPHRRHHGRLHDPGLLFAKCQEK